MWFHIECSFLIFHDIRLIRNVYVFPLTISFRQTLLNNTILSPSAISFFHYLSSLYKNNDHYSYSFYHLFISNNFFWHPVWRLHFIILIIIIISLYIIYLWKYYHSSVVYTYYTVSYDIENITFTGGCNRWWQNFHNNTQEGGKWRGKDSIVVILR